LTDPSGGSIGAYLARQRRLRGISLDELADSTKIPRRSLERLEAGAFDGQSDGFARGFVRTIADALGLDSEDSINRLLGEPPDLEDERSNYWSNYWKVDPRWLVIAVGGSIAIGLVVAAGWLWQRSDFSSSSPDETEIVYRRDAVRALALEQAEHPLQHPPADPSRLLPPKADESDAARQLGVESVENERNRDDPSN
jgi:cytoskeletal protein RodZ